MGIGRQPINSADVALVAPVVREALVVPEDQVVPPVLVVPEDPVAALELELGPVEALELVLVQVEALELVLVPVAALELELGPVEALELVLVQVEALELVLVQVAVALRTRSVIAAHRPDLVRLLEAEEDLAAAVAETTREPAAAEAAIAWEVAE
jgi:hypothetical protein